jgi:uncharacterized MAPEG superfamily protein
MTVDLQLAAFAVVLTWVMVVSASLLKARSLKVAFGNRGDAPPSAPAWIDRADRAAKNMLENLPLFLGLVAIAHLGGRHTSLVDLGAHLFFWARLVYWPIYLAGIPVVRTLIWSVSIAGLALIFTALL